MNWDAIGAIAELAGAIGVFGTLLYLAIQIRNNTQEVRDNTVHSVLDRSVANYSDTLIAGIHPIGGKFQRGEQLTNDEQAIFMAFLVRNLQHAELVYIQYRKGRIEQEVMDAYNEKIRGYMNSLNGLQESGYKREGIWSDPLFGFTTGFKDYVREIIKDDA